MLSAMKQSPNNPLHQNALMRGVFFGLGVMFFGLGLLGVVVPGLPTTVFILLAAYCWAKSSRRFYAYLLRHKIFGKMIIDWQERRAMPRFAKYMAWGMMSVSVVVLLFSLPDGKLWVAGLVGTICLAVSIWMARLPDA